MNEKRLVRRMQQNEAKAFTEFVELYGGRVCALARRYTRCEADAEDITQEVFVDLCRGIHNFRGKSSLATWVYRVALNHCLKRQAATQRRPDSVSYEDTLHHHPDDQSDPARHVAQGELAGEVQNALGNLSADHREVVVLHEMHGLTYAECAAVLEIPIGTVKSRLSNAFRRLREGLAGYVLGDATVSGTVVRIADTSTVHPTQMEMR